MPLNKVTALALVILVTSPVIARAQSISIEKLVLTGEFVDDPTIDTRYDSFDPAVYSDSGHVLVHTTIKGTDAFMGVKEDAIVLLQPGVAPRIVAREWRPLEGLSPTDFVDFLYDEPQISPQGEVAFFAGLRSQKTSDDRTVLVWFDGADYYELAAFDGQVPGQPAGVTFERIFKIQSISGQLAVHAQLRGLPQSPTDLVNALVLLNPQQSEILVQFRQALPGYPPEAMLLGFPWPGTLLSGSGPFFFSSAISGFEQSNDQFHSGIALFAKGVDTPLTAIAAPNGQAAGIPDDVRYDNVDPIYYFSNDRNEVVFGASLVGDHVEYANRLALFSNAGGQPLAPIIRSGDQVPDEPPGVIYERFRPLGLNNAGELVAQSYRSWPGIDDSNYGAISSNIGGHGMRTIIRQGDPAVGFEPGTRITESAFFGTRLNERGQIAYRAETADEDNNAYGGIFITTRLGRTYLVVREGQFIDVDNDPNAEDLRQIQSLVYFFGLDNNGQISFQADLTDGTSGLFVATIEGLCNCPGDANNDQTINALDISSLVDCIVNPSASCECADVDDSPGVGLSDINLLVQILLATDSPCH